LGLIDADGTYPSEAFPELLAAVRAGAHQAIGARPAWSDAEPWARSCVKAGFRAAVRHLGGCAVPDLNSGMRVLRREDLVALEPVLPDGFSLSTGAHDILVPHFYLLEYRDPYATFPRAKNYDSALAEPSFSFYRNADTGAIEAADIRYRPGVLTWYYNGEFPWSENDPATSGIGNGFLLLVDSTPQEFQIPAVPSQYFKDVDGLRWYDFDAGAQTPIRQGFLDVMCFQRRPGYYALDLAPADRAACTSAAPPGERANYEGRPLLYSFTLNNELLPGEARESRKSMGSLYDIRVANGATSFRLNDPLMRKVSGPATIIRREHVAVPAAKQSALKDAKVYLLTSKKTFSAAEHLSLALKRTKRATLIGEATGGGAHFGGMGPMGAGYAAFVPVGRTFDPDTGESWEGTGVAPDIAVPADKALDEALKLAGVKVSGEVALAELK
jgi:hypothetical protein